MPLTEEEKTKIEEEERLRAETRAKYTKPQEVKIKRKTSCVSWGCGIIFAIIIAVVIITIVSTGSQKVGTLPAANSSIIAAIKTNKSELATAEDKTLLDQVIQAATTISGLPAEKNPFREIDLDSFLPNSPLEKEYGKDARFVTIQMNSLSSGLSLAYHWGTGRWDASKLFEYIFPVNQNIQSVEVVIYVPTTDRLGNTKDTLLMDVNMSRKVFQLINWSGFDYEDMPGLLQDAWNKGDILSSYSEDQNISQ